MSGTMLTTTYSIVTSILKSIENHQKLSTMFGTRAHGVPAIFFHLIPWKKYVNKPVFFDIRAGPIEVRSNLINDS